ncbi:MAG: hypothetical protein WKG00_08990 [Polyangiaceae bacterium]
MANEPPRRTARVYRPTLVRREEGWEQRFEANVLTIEPMVDLDGTVVALVERDPPLRGPLEAGPPIHSLLLELTDVPEEEDGAGEITFNDADNERSIDGHLERVELAPAWLRVVYVAGEGPMASRASLPPSAEIFDLEDGDPPEEPLRSVRVGLGAVTSQMEELRATLRQHLGDKMVERDGQGD